MTLERGYADVGVCPVCRQPVTGRGERLEPVVWQGRDYGWKRRIVTYTHVDGTTHRVPGPAVFDA